MGTRGVHIFALCALAGSTGCAEGVIGDYGEEITDDRTIDGCDKTVHVHLANWASADPLDDPRSAVQPNGCWTFDMAHEYGHYWAHCKGASNKGTKFPGTWVVNWGSPSTWDDGGPRKWVYNETRKDRSPYPSDSQRIDNCWSHMESHWGTTPTQGYEYMMYQGASGWFKSGNTHVARSFAELYGPGTWWPHWKQWKAHPVGRPMAQIVDAQQRGNAHTVVKGMCDYVTSGNWIGLWVPNATGKLAYDSPAFQGIVSALNQCTGGSAFGDDDGSADPPADPPADPSADPPADPPPPPAPSPADCDGSERQCTGTMTYRQCESGEWSEGWSCASFPGTVCDSTDGFCRTPTCGLLPTGSTLSRGESWDSCDGRFVLTMQDDGNLVLYQSGAPLWATNTWGSDAQTAVMQEDGNFLLKDSGWNTLWAAGTWGHPGAFATVQNDGNLVIYGAGSDEGALWASNTGGH